MKNGITRVTYNITKEQTNSDKLGAASTNYKIASGYGFIEGVMEEGSEMSSVALLSSFAADEAVAAFGIAGRAWEESKKLWTIVGPAMVTRLAMNAMIVVTQAFVGHLGDLQLASMTIATTVIVGFNFGLLVIYNFLHCSFS